MLPLTMNVEGVYLFSDADVGIRMAEGDACLKLWATCAPFRALFVVGDDARSEAAPDCRQVGLG